MAVYEEVMTERLRQDRKWGQQNHDPFLYLTILGEEYGEACEAALSARFADSSMIYHLRTELIEIAAVAIAAVECIDRESWAWGGHQLSQPPAGMPPAPPPPAEPEHP